MDDQALALLKAVAKRYAELRSLALDMTVANEMEDVGQRNEQRSRAMYVAPNLVRTEAGRGKTATVVVADGSHQHNYFGTSGHYVKTPIESPLPGFFQPERPSGGQAPFLFHQIADRIEDARLESAGVLLVHYAWSNRISPGLPQPSGPVRFQVDPRTYFVTRVEADVLHGQRIKTAATFSNFAVDQPFASATFEFTPPPGVVDRGTRGALAAGSSSGNSGPGYETRQSQSMGPDGTFIEHTKLKLRGKEFTLERRLRLSENGRELSVVERASASGGAPQQWDTTVLVP